MAKTYYALAEGFIENVYRYVGDEVGPLSVDQAKYLLLAGTIGETQPVKEQAAAPKKAKADE